MTHIDINSCAHHEKHIPLDFTGIIDRDGTKSYFKNGKLHNEDGPSIEWSDGTQFWYLNGLLHRENNPAIFVTMNQKNKNTYKAWYKHGKLHRNDGPAMEMSDGTKNWYKEGLLHREDGPACEFSTGDKLWYKNGIQYTQEQFETEQNKNSLLNIIINTSHIMTTAIRSALQANNQDEDLSFKKNLCRCDASVGMIPCSYCEVHRTLQGCLSFFSTIQEKIDTKN